MYGKHSYEFATVSLGVVAIHTFNADHCVMTFCELKFMYWNALTFIENASRI